MTEESLQFLFDKFLVLNGRDANAVLCDPKDSHDKEMEKFCWDHNLQIYECFTVLTGELKFIRI